jgi:hypothetical protein
VSAPSEPVTYTLGWLCFLAKNKDLFSAGASILALGGLGSLIVAILQYLTAQIWKRNEFLAKALKEIYSAPAVVDVESMAQ